MDPVGRDRWIVVGGVVLAGGVWLVTGLSVLASAAGGLTGSSSVVLPGSAPGVSALVGAGLDADCCTPVAGALLCGIYGLYTARSVPRLAAFGAAVAVTGALAVIARLVLTALAMGVVLG